MATQYDRTLIFNSLLNLFPGVAYGAFQSSFTYDMTGYLKTMPSYGLALGR